MTRSVKNWIVALCFAVFVGGTAVSLAAPDTTFAAGTTCTKASRVLTFPVWYRGLNVSESDCTIISPDQIGGIGPFIWRVVLNVIEIGLQLVGYIAFFFIIYGGFQFLTSGGDPSKAASSRQTILNAVIGLVISFASIAIVNLIVGIIK